MTQLEIAMEALRDVRRVLNIWRDRMSPEAEGALLGVLESHDQKQAEYARQTPSEVKQ